MLNRKRNDNIEDIDLEIEEWRAQDKKKVTIILFPGEDEYLIAQGYSIKPLFYQIKGKKDAIDCPNFMKIKHNKKNKKIFKLKHREKKLLDDYGIKYEALGVILYL